MKTFKYLLTTAVAGIALSGCAADTTQIAEIRSVVAQGGTPFTQAHTTEYRIQPTEEADEGEWGDASFFARKGLRAARGEAVLPAEVAAAPAGSPMRYGELEPVMQIPAEFVPALSSARRTLMAFLDGGGRTAQAVRRRPFHQHGSLAWALGSRRASTETIR